MSTEKDHLLYQTIGQRIRIRRVAQQLNQTQLAEKLGAHQALVSAWERGVRIPRLDDAIRLATALDTTVGELIGETRTGSFLMPEMIKYG